MTNEYDEIIAVNADKYAVPFEWIKAVVMQESSGNPNAYRAEPAINDASYGLMQLLYSTAKGLGYTGTPEGLYDPMINIGLGSKLIGQIRQRVGDDFAAMYSAYNSGSPTRYQTNPQVAQHVALASSWLDKVKETLSQAASDVAGSLEDGSGSGTILLVIAAGVAAYLLFFRG